jgi:P27 family predicted phage terminase small subunit
VPGRKPKPKALRLLGGNAGHRPVNSNEPKPERGVPPCPKHVSARAKMLWRKVGKQLDAMGVITKADGLGLELLVQAYDEYMDARDLIRGVAELKVFQGQLVEQKDGLVYESISATGTKMIRAHPAVGIAENAWRRVATMIAEFGMTPSSRTKVSVAGGADGEDPFDAFLAGANGQKQA